MAKRYLAPKADLTFKRVFGEHPDLLISLLNALLPFKTKEEEIQSVEYLTPFHAPDNLFFNENDSRHNRFDNRRSEGLVVPHFFGTTRTGSSTRKSEQWHLSQDQHVWL